MKASSKLTNIKYIDHSVIRIPVLPLIQQQRDCLMVCLQMILNYYDFKIARENLDQFFIDQTTAFSINPELTELAFFAQKYGFTTDLFSCNLFYSSLKDAQTLEDKMIKRLEGWQKRAGNRRFIMQIASTLQALRSGIKYFTEKPSVARIEEYLKKGTPLIAIVNYSTLHDRQSEDLETGHSIIICGQTNTQFYIIDPNHGKEELIDKDQVLFAIMQNKPISQPGYLLAIKK